MQWLKGAICFDCRTTHSIFAFISSLHGNSIVLSSGVDLTVAKGALLMACGRRTDQGLKFTKAAAGWLPLLPLTAISSAMASSLLDNFVGTLTCAPGCLVLPDQVIAMIQMQMAKIVTTQQSQTENQQTTPLLSLMCCMSETKQNI